jgi:hypothetical protein
MTTNANKHGLRAAAAERSRKHSQRTPLPPRAGVVEDAREVLASVRPVESAQEAPDARSHTKAQAFAELAVAAKWEALLEVRGDAVEVTARRGAETIVQAWAGGLWQYDASVYAFADRNTKPRNASGAAKLLTRSENDAAMEMNKVATNKHFRKREPQDLAPIALPLDPELLTDAEAEKFFRGQTVKWYNRISRGVEAAMVGRHSPVHITRWEDETIINFCCPVSGFRSFRLSGVLALSGARDAIREVEAAREKVAA